MKGFDVRYLSLASRNRSGSNSRADEGREQLAIVDPVDKPKKDYHQGPISQSCAA